MNADPSDPVPAPAASLEEVLSGLQIHTLEVVWELDRPVFLPLLVTKTIRGLAGNALLRADPSLTARTFKPGDGNHARAAYVFQPAWTVDARDRRVAFRIFTWDREGELVRRWMEVLGMALEGCPFGQSGARIVGAGTGPVQECRFQPDPGRPRFRPEGRIHLITPLCLRGYPPPPPAGAPRSLRKPEARPLGPAEIAVGHLVRSLVGRINGLSQIYGNGRCLGDDPFLNDVAFTPVLATELRRYRTRKRDADGGRKELAVEGVTGSIRLGRCPEALGRLIDAGALFHVGRETSLGCGAVVWIPEPQKPRRGAAPAPAGSDVSE